MDWKPASEGERVALKRIVALLCALADLAELAAGRSAAVRALVLWILRHGVAAARKLVAEGPDPSLAFTGAAPADAMRLAAGLRALARQIDLRARLAPAARRLRYGDAVPQASGPMAAFRNAPAGLSTLSALPWPVPHPAHAPDTS